MSPQRFRQLIEPAVALHQAGNLDAAEAAYKKILQESPNHPDALQLLGVIAHQRARHHEALGLISHAINLNPQPGSDYFANLGAVWNALGSYDGAAEAFRQCLKLDPKNAGIYVSLARALNRPEDHVSAVAACRTAIEINPNLQEAHRELAVNLYSIGEVDQAIAAYREALRLNPNDPQTHSNLIFAMETQQGISQESLLAELKEWNRVHAEPVKHLIKPHKLKSFKNRRLSIGWMSGDFRHHVVGRCMLPVFREFDRSQFENFCYSNVEHPDAMTYAIRTSVDHWRDISPLSPQQAADLIRSDGIDVLVDLALHSGLIGLPIFALKPAPIQVCYLGYCGSTGLETMDYRISQRDLDPPDARLPAYVEKSLRLSGSFLCYRPEAVVPDVSPLPALSNGFITFGCLNNSFKISASTLDLWGGILGVVANSRLLVYAPAASVRQRIQDRLKAHGIDLDRLEFRTKMPWLKYVETFSRMDVALDTSPYGAGITACDCLLMGVPMVTLRGDRPVGRMCSSILKNIGHAGLIAGTPDQYVQIAVNLASNLQSLTELRTQLRPALEASPVMNAGAVAKELQDIFTNISQQFMARH